MSGWAPPRGRAALTVLLIAFATVVAAGPAGASDGPENGRISFGRLDPALGTTTLWTAEADGSDQRRLTRDPSFFSDWSPTGTRIAFDFEDETGVHIATARPDGTQRRTITPEPGVQEVPDWSPDGRWIVYNADYEVEPVFSTSIWLMRADGRDAHQLTRQGFDVEPVFSPDGKRIAFSRLIGDSPDGFRAAVYVINVDGTGLRQVIPPRPGLEHPDWSPDGRWITVNIEGLNPTAPDAGDVLAVRPDGRGLHVLLHATERFDFFKPVWSPDGRRLLLGCFDAHVQRDRLCTSTATGDQLRVIPLGREWLNFPAWGARGRAGQAAGPGSPAVFR